MTRPTVSDAKRVQLTRGLGISALLGALVLASRLWLAEAWATPVPYWDQWDAEGALYHAWLTHSLDWRQLFAPHNEHRIALTRLADLALLEACGRWSVWAQLGLNATLHATTGALLGALFWPALAPRARLGWIIGLAILYGSVAGWQNALWGFQSQVYFADLLGLGGIALLTLTPPWHARWWIGIGSLVVGLFSQAGGLFAALAAGIALIPRARDSRGWRPFFAPVLVAALGFALQGSAPHHAALRAQDTAQFLQVFARGLSWPLADSAWLWVIVQLPLVWLWVDRRRRGLALDPAERCALALAAYAALHAAAVAYGRGAGLPDSRFLSRYQDPLHLSLAAQFFAALRLASQHGRPGRLATLGWSAGAVAGLLALSLHALQVNLPFKRAQDQAGLELVRQYASSRDPGVFPPPSSFSSPHPDPAAVIRVLDDPVLKPVLPAEFTQPARPPLPFRIAAPLTLVFAMALALGLLLVARPTADPSSVTR